MIKKIRFYFDENGNPLEKPRVVSASNIPASCFYIEDGDGRFYPQIWIIADHINLKTHPWVEVGNPPRMMFGIVCPTIKFSGRWGMEIVGFEEPSMMLAGLIREPYEGRKGVKGVKYVAASVIDKICSKRTLSGMHKQKIVCEFE